MDEINKSLHRKRLIKWQKTLERRFPAEIINPTLPLETGAIRIEFKDESDLIHFPLTKDDVAKICEYLPADVLDGLDSINFCLGKEYQEEDADECDSIEIDPYTNRNSVRSSKIFGVEGLPEHTVQENDIAGYYSAQQYQG